MDGARGRARTAILPRVHLGGEPQIFYYFRVFRAFRGINDFYYSCPFVSIRGSKMVFRAFRGFLIGISWIRNIYGVSAMTRKWIVQGSGALIQYDARGSSPSEGW